MHGGTWAKKQDKQFQKMRKWDDETSQGFFDTVVAFGVPSVVWGGNYFRVPPSRCWLVWNKPEFPTMSSAELAWTNLDANTKRIECNRTHQEDGEKQHATQKPVKVIEWSLSFLPDGLIYDPFSGSGTTLIACEQTGRKCRAIDIDPGYVAVAIQRWVDVTGGTPELLTA
jgi:DNA modification methylase